MSDSVNEPRRDSHQYGMWSRTSGIIVGLLLIVAGAILLAVNTFNMVLPFDLGRVGWPVFVIAPGLALLVIGLITAGEAGTGLAVAGGIVTTVGLILSYQYSTDHWTSWAYAWALIAPTSVGAAMLLWGIFHGRGDVARQGLSGLGVGLIILIIGFAFFEGVLHLGGERGLAPLGRQALPV
ncbi:MAG: LiaI-LiaF-like domain-containing protein, partial [Candidatus Limnocylindrales bacterium]